MAIDLEPAIAGDVFPKEHPRVAPTALGWLGRAAFVVVVGAVSLYYVLHFEPAHSDVLATGVIVGIGALSLNVLVGYSGQISLGHQAFIGIGAFTSAYVISQSHQSFYAGLAAAAVVGIAQAVVLGLVALRVRGLYFALVTLVWGFVGENSIFRLESFTGGGAGQDAPRPPQLDPVEGDSQGFRILRPRAELQRRRAAHLAQLHGALAPAPRRLRPLVDRSSRRQQGDVGRAVGEAREAQSRGQRTGYDAHGQLDARAVERPAEHGLPARAQSVALPGAEAAGEGLVARAQVDEEGRRSLQQGQDGEQGQGPEGGSGQGGPKEAGHPQARP